VVVGMNRTERHQRALSALLRFAMVDPVMYDEMADAGELRERLVDAVDDALAERGAA
jgi:hypothetical protein